MNRHKRMEAIARQRAFIDNQIKILSSANEARIPNIIRSRAGRSQHAPIRLRQMHTLQEIETVEVDPVPHDMGIDFEEEVVETSTGMFQTILPQSQPGNGFPGGMYVTLLDQSATDKTTNSYHAVQSFMEQLPSHNNTPVQIEIHSDIVQLLANSNEQLSQSFQTFQTDDGTLMIMLEGSEFANKQVNVEPESTISDHDHLAEVSDATTGSQTEAHALPSTEDNSEEIGEETYVIVQTPDGDVLIPTSMTVTESQNQTCDDIFNLVDEETGHDYNYITENSDLISFPQSVTLQTQFTTISAPICTERTKLHKLSRNNGFPSIPRKKTNKIKSVKTNPKPLIRKSTSTQVNHISKLTMPLPYAKQEKPKPFRFELPEDGEDINDISISVPIPIKIDNLYSEKCQIGQPVLTNEPEAKVIETNMYKVCAVNQTQLPNCKSLMELQEAHQVLQLFKCGECFEKCESEIGLVNHMQLHQQEETFKCNICKKCFQNQSGLTSHLNYCGVKTFGKVGKEFPVTVIKPEYDEIETEVNIFEKNEVPKQVTNHCKETSHSCSLEIVHNCKYSVLSGRDTSKSLQHVLQSDGPPKKIIKQLLLQNIDTLNIYQGVDSNEESTLKLSSADVIGVGLEHSNHPESLGRRTLYKATAKATMSKVDVHMDEDLWEPKRVSSYPTPTTVNVEYVNGALISEKSARIRARHSRIKAMAGKAPNEEEIEVNFRNIFQNVVKHGPT